MPSHFKTKFKRTVRKVFFFLGLLALVAVTLPATGTPGFDGAVNVIGGVLDIEKGRACLRGVHSASQVSDRPGLSAAESCRQAKNPVTYAVNLAGRAQLVSKLASGETPRTSAGAR